MNGLHGAVLTVRFLCEVGMLAALAYWGFEAGDGALGVALGLGAPLVAIAIWGAFVAPKARLPVALSTRLVLEVLLFGATGAALAAVGLWATAAIFLLLALASSFLNARQERLDDAADTSGT
jgi:hypothetical protein